MRQPSYLHNLSLIRFLTFASVIGSQFHILSTSAAPATVTHFQLDALDTTKRLSTSGTEQTYSSSTAQLYATSTTSALYASKMSIITSGNSISGIGGGGSKTTAGNAPDGAKSYSSGSGSSDADGSGNGSTTSDLPNGGAAAATSPTMKNSKSPSTTSKFPQDYTISKNHWSNSATFRAFSPSAASVSSLSSLASSSSLSSLSASATDVDRMPRTFRNKHHHERHWGPFFEEPLNSNATSSGDNLVSTAHLFTEAVLNCRVGMLKDKTVMWVRRTDEKVSLLTVGNVTYSGDPRIRVKFQYPNNWRLLINPTHREDAGVYMCQVSTHPPRVFTTNLSVLEPPLRLIDDQEREVGDRYYKSGSTIDLQCQVSRSFLLKERTAILKSMEPFGQNHNKTSSYNKDKPIASTASGANLLNQLVANVNRTAKQTLGVDHSQGLGGVEKQFNNFIFWTKDDETLPPAAVKRTSTTDKWLSSRVSVPDAKIADSGNYSCSIGKLFTAIVQVQVLTGELPAAVQHNTAPASPVFASRLHFVIAFTVIYISRHISPSMRTGLASCSN